MGPFGSLWFAGAQCHHGLGEFESCPEQKGDICDDPHMCGMQDTCKVVGLFISLFAGWLVGWLAANERLHAHQSVACQAVCFIVVKDTLTDSIPR